MGTVIINGSVRAATAGAEGFDADTPLTELACAALVAAGMTFAIRYVGFSGQQATTTDLTAVEVQTILSAGLALMIVQHVRYAGWNPSATLGAADGGAAVQHARATGVATGTCLWCDLEGISGSADDTIAHANAWTSAVRAAGYDPGVYVGAGVPLMGAQWFQALTVQRYWKSLSQVPEVATRGYQMVQRAGGAPVAGIGLDRNRIQADNEGDLPMWFAPDPRAPSASIASAEVESPRSRTA
jgi:hypothetical protein